jgi:hypothetical protein
LAKRVKFLVRRLREVFCRLRRLLPPSAVLLTTEEGRLREVRHRGRGGYSAMDSEAMGVP